MLNPNRADARLDDPTIRRCIAFAQTWGYGSLEVMNLFAYRTANPAELRRVSDPIGVENDRYLAGLTERIDCLLLAWGNWGRLRARDQAVLPLLSSAQPMYCLGRTKVGQPRHPLYLRRDSWPVTFDLKV